LIPTTFTIYDASAGSGKTYTLTKEYLKILFLSKTDDAYKKILAITFTNKAVQEMKSRIVSSLYEFSIENTSEKAMDLMRDVAHETNLSRETIKDKSKAIIKNIIHNYAAFDISTIDKFTHKVIRTFAQDLSLPPNFEVSLDTDTLLQEAIDLVISKAGEEVNLTNLLIEFSKEQSEDDKNWDISSELLKVAKLITNENSAAELSELEDKSLTDFSNIKTKLKQQIGKIKMECKTIAENILAKIDDNGVARKSFSRAVFTNHLVKFSADTFDINLTMIKYLDGSESRYAKTVPHADKEFIDLNAEEFLESALILNKKVGELLFYQAFSKNISPLSLLNTIYQEFKKIQEEQNIVSISDFNKIIHNEIKNQPAPFIYERLGEKYRHYFVDEFQDTSVMQWQNLVPLIDNALSGQDDFGNPGTLMLVGDPKQAIYRWRGGKAEQFIDLAKNEQHYNPFSNKNKKTERLGTNYRSFSEIITFNNAFFKQLSSEFENEDYKNLYENLSHQNTNSKQGGYVNITFIDPEEDSEGQQTEFIPQMEEQTELTPKDYCYLEQIQKTIENCKANGFAYKDIVILTRTKVPGIKIANFLTENSIPILSSETLLIQNATEVKLVIALLRFLKNEKDQEAKFYFLYYIATNLQNEIPVHDFIATNIIKNQDELEHFLITIGLEFSFQNNKKKSLYECVELMISAFLNTKVNTSYLQYFLDLVLEKDVKTQSSIADFLDYWDKIGFKKSIPSPEGTDAVRIMTIHKSKGLEFPVVIYPYADESLVNKPKESIWLPLENTELDLPKALLNNTKEVVNFSETAKTVYNAKKQEEKLDGINVLYVALTRAEEQLYIISSKNLTKSGDFSTSYLSYYFLNFLEQQQKYNPNDLTFSFGDVKRISTLKKFDGKNKNIGIVANKLHPKNIKIAQREALMWGTTQQEAITFGVILHEILAFINTKKDIDLAILKATEIGLITFSQQELFKETISKIINNKELIPFFEEGTIVFNEQNIIKKHTKTIKPDRVVIKNNEAYLLDYKTGEKNNKHIIQINEYEKALQEMHFSVAKKTLIYIGEEIEIITL